MNRTISRETTPVPLQKANGSWINEPGYGGTVSAWEAFDAHIDAGLKAFEKKYPGPAKMPVGRQSEAKSA